MTAPSSRQQRSCKVGVILPLFEDGLDGKTPKWSDLAEFARVAEDVGFDSLWIPDHLVFHADDGTASGMWDGWSLLAAVSAVTHRIELGTFVTCAGWRNPALLAKMADTVDEISSGRLILGLGAGWHAAEFRAFGFPYDHRFARFEEAIAIITGLLRHGYVDVVGTYWSARECELRPRGPRQHGPPIMIGTTGKRMLALTAQYADLWNVWFDETDNDINQLQPLLEIVDAACAAVGRVPETLERTAAVNVDVFPISPSPKSIAPLTGTPEELADQLRAHAAIGITHLQVWPEPNSSRGLERFARVLEAIDRG
jgi:alkanesulfonate monooxygenase SsuD/methylene tetrahydromethanopterin reductase-like flavin-dependent oxidoreductase (luciferase family)